MADPTRPVNKIDFYNLDGSTPLANLLALVPPPFQKSEVVFAQVKFLEDYIRRADMSGVGERSIAVEAHYVDRDFMSDHSVLFASTLQPPPNYCRRVHFFAGSAQTIRETLMDIGNSVATKPKNGNFEYRAKCAEFSDQSYLGFAVVRPLAACPVGRTVLRLLPRYKAEDDSQRIMNCTKKYEVHFLGVTLTIRGLAFQQQDLGVSRCSTVALWSALHKAGQKEHLPRVTPADITSRASKYRLPFGRPMPSEGLLVEQMCLALQSLGVSPFLGKISSFAQGRSLIFSSTLSAMPCVLVMEYSHNPALWHAVTVAGMKVRAKHEACFVKPDQPAAGDDDSGDLRAVYVHDDRVGPYLRAATSSPDSKQLRVRLNVQGHAEPGVIQEWIVRQVLIPLHPKVRVSFNDLRNITTTSIIPEIQKVVAAQEKVRDLAKLELPTIRFRHWMERSYKYTHRMLDERLLSDAGMLRFRTEHVMSRYVGIIRCSSPSFGQLDVVVDTTSPKPNYSWIAVLAKADKTDAAKLRHLIGEYLAEKCRCSYFE